MRRREYEAGKRNRKNRLGMPDGEVSINEECYEKDGWKIVKLVYRGIMELKSKKQIRKWTTNDDEKAR